MLCPISAVGAHVQLSLRTPKAQSNVQIPGECLIRRSIALHKPRSTPPPHEPRRGPASCTWAPRGLNLATLRATNRAPVVSPFQTEVTTRTRRHLVARHTTTGTLPWRPPRFVRGDLPLCLSRQCSSSCRFPPRAMMPCVPALRWVAPHAASTSGTLRRRLPTFLSYRCARACARTGLSSRCAELSAKR